MPFSSQLFDTRYRLLFIRAIASPFIIQNIYLLNEKAQKETSTLTFIVSNCFLMAGFINNSTFTISISKRNRFHKTVLLMQVNSKLKKICNSVLIISSGTVFKSLHCNNVFLQFYYTQLCLRIFCSLTVHRIMDVSD